MGMQIMKKRVMLVVSAAVLAAVVLCGFVFFRDNDETRIKAALNELCNIGAKGSGENPAFLALKANKADRVFAPECVFNFRLHMMDGAITPTEIGSRILRIQALFKWIKLDFSELEIEVQGDRAKVFFTGTLRGEMKNSGTKTEELREIEAIFLRQKDGAWKIARMDVKNILEK